MTAMKTRMRRKKEMSATKDVYFFLAAFSADLVTVNEDETSTLWQKEKSMAYAYPCQTSRSCRPS